MSCFWINLVQAEQECADTPAPGGDGVLFRGSEGDGSSSGRLCLPAVLWDFNGFEGNANGACDTDILALLVSAASVEVTGYVPWDWGSGTDPEDAQCGYPVPDDGYTPVSLEMVSEYNSFDGYDQWVYYFGGDEEPPVQGWYFVRLLIDGTTELYGLLRRGGGV